MWIHCLSSWEDSDTPEMYHSIIITLLAPLAFMRISSGKGKGE